MASKVSDLQSVSPSKPSRYRPEIDGLRAFAVVTVIINHFNKDILPGGYLGVDIFFVISGYVITSSLFGRPSKDFKDFISGFYERRIKRLVPALSVFVLITSIAICLFNPSPGTSLKTGLTSLFGLSNLYLLKLSTDYFSQTTELNVFTHTWSLGVEEQFYILFPFLIWFSGFGRQSKNGARNLFLIVSVLTIASLIGFLYLYPTNQPAAYFLMPSRFWEMAAGCLIFIGFQKRASIEQFLEKVPPLLVLVLIIGVMYLPMSMAAASTITVVFLSSILIACLKKQTAAFKVFTNPQVVYIGLISYSLYLWHWGVLSISRWTIGIHWWSVPIQVYLIFLLATISYNYVEKPSRYAKTFPRAGTIITGILIILGSAFTNHFILANASKHLFLGEKKRLALKESTFRKEFNNSNCMYSSAKDKVSAKINFENCFFKDGRLVKNRLIHENRMTVFLYGNSYTGQMLPAYEQLSKHYPDVGFFMYGVPGCPASTGITYKSKPYCSVVFKEYLNWLYSVATPGDKLVVGTSLGHLLPQQYEYVKSIYPKSNYTSHLESYMHELRQLNSKLKPIGISLFVTSGIPILRTEPSACSDWFNKNNDKCIPLIDSELSDSILSAGNKLQKLNRDGITIIDIYSRTESLLSSKNHRPVDIYSNKDHIGQETSLLLTSIVENDLGLAIGKAEKVQSGT